MNKLVIFCLFQIIPRILHHWTTVLRRLFLGLTVFKFNKIVFGDETVSVERLMKNVWHILDQPDSSLLQYVKI